MSYLAPSMAIHGGEQIIDEVRDLGRIEAAIAGGVVAVEDQSERAGQSPNPCRHGPERPAPR
jgi:hypothetical protein